MTSAPQAAARTAVRRARVWLTRAAEPGQAAMYALVRLVGPVEAVHLIRSRQAPPTVQSAVGTRSEDDRVDQDISVARRFGIRLVTPEDAQWPVRMLHPMVMATERGLLDIAPPLAVWVRGPVPLDEAVERSVAVIGSRASTAYGEHVAAEIAFGLADRGWTVVSGGALGIDGAAHRAALAAEGVTVAVLAGGLDRPYPAAHGALFERIAGSGLLLSEWPPGCAPYRRRFLIRNRLIAALSAGTVVVEASARSGTASTARRCRELGRSLMAVPGPVTSAVSVGTHELLRGGDDGGARLVTSTGQVLEEVGRLGEDMAQPPRAPPGSRDGLDALARAVLDSVPVRRAVAPERIARAAGVAVLDVLRVLPSLELQDLVELTEGGWRLSQAERRTGDHGAGG
ncbi:MAG: DNA-protecting protein DprA [Geodermatophilaceae bacterium]|nr:DNA-protecting protein DprA [Geodermatophilaceae bacterium]